MGSHTVDLDRGFSDLPGPRKHWVRISQNSFALLYLKRWNVGRKDELSLLNHAIPLGLPKKQTGPERPLRYNVPVVHACPPSEMGTSAGKGLCLYSLAMSGLPQRFS